MKFPIHIMALAALASILAGCSTPEPVPPKVIPVIVKDYRVPGLKDRCRDVTAKLDLSECAERAVLSSRGISGTVNVVGSFPIREIVQKEFARVIACNFRTTMDDELPKLEIRIKSEAILVERNFKTVKSVMHFEVVLANASSAEKPYFVKTYKIEETCIQKDKRIIPVCVYTSVQMLVEQFIKDVKRDGSLILRLDMLDGLESKKNGGDDDEDEED